MRPCLGAWTNAEDDAAEDEDDGAALKGEAAAAEEDEDDAEDEEEVEEGADHAMNLMDRRRTASWPGSRGEGGASGRVTVAAQP